MHGLAYVSRGVGSGLFGLTLGLALGCYGGYLLFTRCFCLPGAFKTMQTMQIEWCLQEEKGGNVIPDPDVHD